ncbi:ATP-binding protein [Methylophaga sp. 42_25_T18]|nr:ATP-binding protein [Methylophaga sp. 42_25_T18]OUR85815.1 ATP-binding protein [Methylophaga sp. 42_8_T64]
MPRKLLKRFMPDHKAMQEHPHLQKFGQRLTEPKLWHLNRKSIAGGAALGLFIGFMPIVGQMFVAAALAIFFRVNLPFSVSAVWISNPLTVAPMYFYAYKIGAWVLQVPVGQYSFELTWEWFSHEFLAIWQPLLLGSFICGIIAAVIGVIVVRIVWRLIVIRNWLQRRHKNKNS